MEAKSGGGAEPAVLRRMLVALQARKASAVSHHLHFLTPHLSSGSFWSTGVREPAFATHVSCSNIHPEEVSGDLMPRKTRTSDKSWAGCVLLDVWLA